MIEKCLIANRGEIALRIIRACRELKIRSVSIFSETDIAATHVRQADEAYLIGPAPAPQSYLNAERIVELADIIGADAIHPGYGFLAENADFAEKCEKKNLTFVGPSSETLRLTGNKLACKQAIQKTGVPVIPGSGKILEEENDALSHAEEIGYPVLVKSAFGGGGRGIRPASTREELLQTFRSALREAKAAFGRFGAYVEKLIVKPRHIEFQVLADTTGNIVHLGERECSIQRRFQKLVEMSPSRVMTNEKRASCGSMAIKAAQAVRYRNAGTVEFLMDDSGQLYFIEVNSRIQVEHPVTELVTGIDLVKSQFRIASDEPLEFKQTDIALRGIAIECRINAEDPFNEFAPRSGKIENLEVPSGPGIRIDTAIYPGYEIPIFYDSLIAKLVSWGHDFEESRLRLRNALDEFVIDSVATTIPLHRFIVRDEDFIRGNLSTSFLDDREIIKRMKDATSKPLPQAEELAASAASVFLSIREHSKYLKQPKETLQERSMWKHPKPEFTIPGEPRYADAV